MDKQDHNRISSVKAKPTTAISLNSGEAQSSYDALAEIRDDYRNTKEQLERYNKFIDNHVGVTVFIPLLLSFLGFIGVAATSSSSDPITGIVAFVATGLFLTGIILALVSASRKSSKAKLEHKMKELREETAHFYRATTLSDMNLSRDELWLLQSDEPKAPKAPSWPGVLIIVIIIGGWFLYNRYTSEQRYANERAYCVSETTGTEPTDYCYSLPNSSLDLLYKVGQ